MPTASVGLVGRRLDELEPEVAAYLVDEQRQLVVDRKVDPCQLERPSVEVLDDEAVGRGIVARPTADGPDDRAGPIDDVDRDLVSVEGVEVDRNRRVVPAGRARRRRVRRGRLRGRDRGGVRRRRGTGVGGARRTRDRCRCGSRAARADGEGDHCGDRDGDTGKGQRGGAEGSCWMMEAGHSNVRDLSLAADRAAGPDICRSHQVRGPGGTASSTNQMRRREIRTFVEVGLRHPSRTVTVIRRDARVRCSTAPAFRTDNHGVACEP